MWWISSKMFLIKRTTGQKCCISMMMLNSLLSFQQLIVDKCNGGNLASVEDNITVYVFWWLSLNNGRGKKFLSFEKYISFDISEEANSAWLRSCHLLFVLRRWGNFFCRWGSANPFNTARRRPNYFATAEGESAAGGSLSWYARL